MNLLNGAEFGRLQSALTAAATRQQVVSDNIANADTPGFKRSEVVFEDLLNDAMGSGMTKALPGLRTDIRHIPIGSTSQVPGLQIVTDHRSTMNNNGSNVDIDREMALLAKNQLRYSSYTEQINHDIRMFRTAMEGNA